MYFYTLHTGKNVEKRAFSPVVGRRVIWSKHFAHCLFWAGFSQHQN